MHMITWNVSPDILSLGPITLRWYGLLFAIAFIFGLRAVERTFLNEKVPQEHVDRLFLYVIVGTIGGARLGHCLFYEPEIYLADPIRILKVWEGGLASHGAAVGIFTALWIYAKRYKMKWLWMADRVTLAVASSGLFIRLGNLFNSEILGKPGDVPWSFVFVRIDQIPRHPTQLYEALSYFGIFLFLLWSYWKRGKGKLPGYMLGTFLIGVFGFRFVWEFFKENQVSFEANLPLNMGQLLSIPLVLLGVWLTIRSSRIASRVA